MSDYKNLKKVIAVSSMAAATIGAGTMVNADNVHQQAVSSQKSSITAKPSSETQNAKSSNTVVLKSSQSSKVSSSAKNVVSSSKASSSSVSAKQAQPMNLAATVTPSMTDAQHDTIQNDINSVNNVINKYQSDDSMAVSTASSNFGTDLVVDALNDYTSGLATNEELQKDVQKVQGVLNDDKDALAKETNAHAKEILQAQVKLDQDAYNLLSQAANGNASQVQTSTSSKASSQSSAKASSQASKKSESKASTSSKASSQASKKSDVKASAKKAASNKAVENNGVKNNAKVAVKAAKVNHQAVISSKKAVAKHTTANSAKKASMPQTGEANNTGILAGIGAFAIVAAGAFLFRKRG